MMKNLRNRCERCLAVSRHLRDQVINRESNPEPAKKWKHFLICHIWSANSPASSAAWCSLWNQGHTQQNKHNSESQTIVRVPSVPPDLQLCACKSTQMHLLGYMEWLHFIAYTFQQQSNRKLKIWRYQKCRQEGRWPPKTKNTQVDTEIYFTDWSQIKYFYFKK